MRFEFCFVEVLECDQDLQVLRFPIRDTEDLRVFQAVDTLVHPWYRLCVTDRHSIKEPVVFAEP